MNKIKKGIFFLLLTILWFGTKQNVKADGLMNLQDSQDKDAIELLKDDIVDCVNDHIDYKKYGKAEVGDIIFEQVVKEYLNVPIFEKSCATTDDLKNILESSVYMWIVPVRVNGYMCEVCVTKNLSENGEMYGDWGVDSLCVYEEGSLTLPEQLETSLIYNHLSGSEYEIVMIGGLRSIRYPVFILMDSEKIIYILPCRSEAAYVLTDSSREDTPIDYAVTENTGYKAFDYPKVMLAEEQQKNNWFSENGISKIDIGKINNSNPYKRCIAMCVIIILILCGIGVINYKRKNIK